MIKFKTNKNIKIDGHIYKLGEIATIDDSLLDTCKENGVIGEILESAKEDIKLSDYSVRDLKDNDLIDKCKDKRQLDTWLEQESRSTVQDMIIDRLEELEGE